MAEFQVQAMADAGTSEQDLPQRGRVTEVCREWLLHEDLALAHRLQNEEYESHLHHNKEKNQILRQDAPKARQEQNREDHEAALAQTAYEMYLAQQEARDAEMAAMLAQKLEMEETEKSKHQQDQDMAYAKNLMDREKETIRQEKELRQVEREAAYLGINSGDDNVAILARKEPRRAPEQEGTSSSSRSGRSARSQISDLSDLSDFCLQPTDGMDEEEVRDLQEDQDAELARLLQSQDGKRRGDLLRQDQLMAIEAQDRELAKVLQEQERAKAKKAREKARQKALQKKQARASQLPREDASPDPRQTRRPESPIDDINSIPQPGPSGYSPQHDTDYPSPRPSIASNESRDEPDPMLPPRGAQLQRPTSLDLPGTSRAPQPLAPIERHIKYAHQFPLGKTNKPRLPEPESIEVIDESISSSSSSTSSSAEHNLSSGFTNIACAIDPTYQRRVMQGELASPQATLQSTSSSSTTSSGNGYLGSSIASPVSPLPPPVFDDDDDYPVPPYMPIQGQRRTASLEKNRRPKPPKDKGNSKEGCKQQ